MARDRKRAKQRRDRRERRPPVGRGSVRTDVRRDDAEELEAPDPLEHASAEVDLAEAQMALGRPEYADDEEPLSEEELVEAEEADAARGGTGDGRGGRRGGGGGDDGEESSLPVPGGAAPARHRELPGNRIIAFLQGSWRELQRVQWPDRRAVAQATSVVVVFVIVAGLYLGLVDAIAQKIVDAIL
jgi:preprotein translocase subunit SecE